MRTMAYPEFTLSVVGPEEWDTTDDNIDVEVRLADGARFAATFFTLANLATLFAKNRETGECSGGTYLWAAQMILVVNLEPATLCETVRGLLRGGEFEAAFVHVSDDANS